MSKLKLDLEVAGITPVRPVAGTETLDPVKPVAQIIDTKEEFTIKVLPVKVNDILDYEVRIAECHARNDIRDIKIRNDYFSIAKIIQIISEGYYITPYDLSEKLEPFFQHAILIEYWYGNEPNFEQKLLDNNILPTLIIKHEGTDNCCVGTDNYATLVYCFKEPIKSEIVMEDIYRYLCNLLFVSEYVDAEIDSYNAYDYGNITCVTVNNILYVPTEGGITHV